MVQIGAGRSDKRYKKPLRVTDLFLTLTVVMITDVITYQMGMLLNMFSVLYANYASTKLE